MSPAVMAALIFAIPLAIIMIGKLYFEAREETRQDREKNEKIALLFINNENHDKK